MFENYKIIADQFAKFHKEYHIEFTEDHRFRIRDDCPKDKFEELRNIDARCFRSYGKHRYTNFETEETSEQKDDEASDK